MSEAIKIQEGGVDRSQNQIYKLKTNTVGGGVCYWVPETERQTDDKRITENGTYTAEEEGLYGYDEIDVSVPNTGKMSGTGADGNEYVVDVDDNGYIVQTKIPSYIVVTTLPAKMEYDDGDLIDYTGIVVTAYDADGTPWESEGYAGGVIPFNELVLPATIAHPDSSGGGASSELDTGNVNQPIPLSNNGIIVVGGTTREFHVSDGYVVMSAMTSAGKNGYAPFYASGNSLSQITRIETFKGKETTTTYGMNSEYTHGGKTVYFRSSDGIFTSSQNRRAEPLFNDGAIMSRTPTHPGQVAWTMVYGDVETSGTQNIPVNWMRPGDFAPLSTQFTISVTPEE